MRCYFRQISESDNSVLPGCSRLHANLRFDKRTIVLGNRLLDGATEGSRKLFLAYSHEAGIIAISKLARTDSRILRAARHHTDRQQERFGALAGGERGASEEHRREVPIAVHRDERRDRPERSALNRHPARNGDDKVNSPRNDWMKYTYILNGFGCAQNGDNGWQIKAAGPSRTHQIVHRQKCRHQTNQYRALQRC